jgi:Zn-dependent M32 family carboxypeptidase
MPSTDAIRKVLESEQLVDELAAVEHERWAHWQRYVHDHCERQADGSLVIPAELAARWEAQIETAYVGLTEREKDSDREQVRRYLPVIIDALTR